MTIADILEYDKIRASLQKYTKFAFETKYQTYPSNVQSLSTYLNQKYIIHRSKFLVN